MKKEKTNCEIARNICIVKALAKLGHFPKRESEKEAWFLSPFRSEIQASFKVDKMINRWYDHGAGKGGNLIDLVCQVFDCSVKISLEIINHKNPSFSFHQQPILEIENDVIKINKIKNITHPALIKYLNSRKVRLKIAQQYCHEIRYEFKDKSYFAIGLKNQSQGWELRNKYFKSSIAPKDITHIKNESDQKDRLSITEGMFDMLSLVSYESNIKDNSDILVLNSVALLDKAIEVSKDYKTIVLYLDNDKSGKSSTKKFLQIIPNSIDRSALYNNYKDVNQWLVSKNEIFV
ncbi:MAG: toprim domain-containing protein [Bacteroidota bacterium]